MSESRMRGQVTKALRPLHAIAVENPCLPGTPDVNFVEGWIELKWLRSWPAGEDAIVRLPHYTAQQRIWAFQRRRAGGQCWFLLQSGREWILLDGARAALRAGRCTKAELVENALWHSTSGLRVEELVQCLSEPLPQWVATKAELVRFLMEEVERA